MSRVWADNVPTSSVKRILFQFEVIDTTVLPELHFHHVKFLRNSFNVVLKFL